MNCDIWSSYVGDRSHTSPLVEHPNNTATAFLVICRTSKIIVSGWWNLISIRWTKNIKNYQIAVWNISSKLVHIEHVIGLAKTFKIIIFASNRTEANFPCYIRFQLMWYVYFWNYWYINLSAFYDKTILKDIFK
jgi:hypothetical protein